mmetsp:Transcript_15651/g.31909  ORF Transcript_15651/g.31909 Transcript_15651/m.31909 type:complete len:306 (+) Transcript_15651:53-970(+)
MSDTSYVPVSERPSNEFSSGLLDSASKMEMGSSSSSPFPSSSSSGFTSNQRSQMSGGLQLPDWLTESLQKPLVKIGIAVSSFVLLIVIIVNASSGGGGGSGSGGYSGPTRAGGSGINCAGMQDMLFGEPVTAHNGHYYQLIGGSFASLTWMDAFHDAVHRCHNGHTGYLASIQSMEENNFILQLIKESKTYLNGAGDKFCWLGAIDMNTEGTFEWVTGNSHTDGVVFWTGGSPNNGGAPVNGQFDYFENSANGFTTGANEPNSNGEEDCVAMRGGHKMTGGTTDGTWNDVACYSRINYFVVEFDG